MIPCALMVLMLSIFLRMGLMFLVVSGMVLGVTGADNVSGGSNGAEVMREEKEKENSYLDCSWLLSPFATKRQARVT